ncbi:MAG: glycerol-3-phosphate acyltransferase, partial [Candidatus Omnitrophica bacterium]|nr:glycerol-3-phosphate acyltransferase [Candidatus Omnitrophota bacterium]
MLWILLGIIISYCIGSFPTAFVFGRLIKGIDIRQFGSGNVGATNALRVLGKKVGITVLCIDIAKGFICVFVIGYFFQGLIPETLAIVSRLLFGVSCIIGHNWTIFLQFKGGKGVASTLGVLIGLAATIPGLYIVLLLVLAT